MPDQIIDAAMAFALYANAMRTRPLVGWIVMRDQLEHSGNLVARLVTDAPTPYVLRGESLAALYTQLPPGLQWSGRQPSDPAEVVEIWLPK